ncbi:MAG: glycerophosphodiester phosphodiesterase [Chloroflexi bacterium]|nr:glycerophosphodiester phosphodiesterase [Chloroflexota bacterium]
MKPLIFGHRGASAYAPENTLAAFKLAFDLGADGVELDVSVTRDGVPVVLHDDTVDRTTNGRGAVKTMTLEEIERLDAGERFHSKFRGERIPTLEQVLSTEGARGIVNIELKSGRLPIVGLETVAVANVIRKLRAQDRVIISSFNHFALHRIKALDARLTLGLLYFNRVPLPFPLAQERPLAQPAALHPRFTVVTEEFVKWAKGKGYKLNTWTVDDPTEARRLADLGVDSIMSNCPDVLRQALST